MKESDIQAAVEALHTIRDWVRWASTVFASENLYYGHGTADPRDEAAYLVLGAIKQPWQDLDVLADAVLLPSERQHLAVLMQRRVNERVPVPYLIGDALYGGLNFHVSPSVLIPRSPILELIENGFTPWLEDYPRRILDICTGSGCLGILAATHFDEALVDLSDISTQALEIAQDNILRHQLSDRVTTYLSDGFHELPELGYDLIISNPPYVDQEDMASLPPEYQHEPRLALASGDDGLDFCRHMLREAARFLNPHGLLVAEVGNSWGALEQAFPHLPFLWPELEQGGHGVFVLTREQLLSSASL